MRTIRKKGGLKEFVPNIPRYLVIEAHSTDKEKGLKLKREKHRNWKASRESGPV
jgi:hypothetical protein